MTLYREFRRWVRANEGQVPDKKRCACCGKRASATPTSPWDGVPWSAWRRAVIVHDHTWLSRERYVLTPLCMSCNVSKGARLYVVITHARVWFPWMPPRTSVPRPARMPRRGGTRGAWRWSA